MGIAITVSLGVNTRLPVLEPKNNVSLFTITFLISEVAWRPPARDRISFIVSLLFINEYIPGELTSPFTITVFKGVFRSKNWMDK